MGVDDSELFELEAAVRIICAVKSSKTN